MFERDIDEQKARARNATLDNKTTLECIMMNIVGQRQFIKNRQGLCSLPGMEGSAPTKGNGCLYGKVMKLCLCQYEQSQKSTTIHTRKDDMNIDVEEKPKTEELQGSKGQKNVLHSWLDDMVSLPNKKRVNSEKSCVKGGLSFEISMIVKSCKNAHGTSLWGLTVTHQNDSSYVNGHILITNGINNMI